MLTELPSKYFRRSWIAQTIFFRALAHMLRPKTASRCRCILRQPVWGSWWKYPAVDRKYWWGITYNVSKRNPTKPRQLYRNAKCAADLCLYLAGSTTVVYNLTPFMLRKFLRILFCFYCFLIVLIFISILLTNLFDILNFIFVIWTFFIINLFVKNMSVIVK